MSEPLHVLIVDDEPLARKYLRSLLANQPDIEIVGECSNGRQAIEAIKGKKPDLVFLDIQMPGKNGFDVLSAVGAEKMPKVIFVTAYDNYAIRAFEAEALDYLLKPFTEARFADALRKARKGLGQFGISAKLISALEQLLARYNLSKSDSSSTEKEIKPLTRLIIKASGKSTVLKVESIDWIEASDYYCTIHSNGKKYLLQETLGWLEQRLDAKRFARVHRSSMVNLEQVKEIQTMPNGESVILLLDGTLVRLSRRRREDLERLLGD